MQVLTEEDYKTPQTVIKNNALGSDLPRSLLGQYVSYVQTMKKFNDFTICPFVIDSPFQQEQDSTNATAIFNFIFSNALEGQQLILGTVKRDGVVEDKDIPEDCLKILLDEKFSLLTFEDYPDVVSEIEPLHNQTLAAD